MNTYKVGRFTIEIRDGDRSSWPWSSDIYLGRHLLDKHFYGSDWREVLARSKEWCKKQ